MDRTNRKNTNHQFLLEAGEIDRITEELMKFLSDEPIDRKDALRLRFVLEETLLNYKDFCPEGTAASLRFSHSFGMIRISLKVEGKKMIRGFLLVTFFLTLICTVCMVPGTDFGNSAKMSIDFFDFFDILISFVPTNILSPILEFNSVHIIIVGVMFGVSMLHMGQKADKLTEAFDEANTVAILSNSYLNRFIPIYVGLMVCGQMLSGSFSVLSGFLSLILMVAAAGFVTLAAYTAIICFRFRVKMRVFIKKLLPSFLISLSSANAGAAFTTTIDTLIGDLGVDADYAPLGYNLGSILFRPGYCIAFTACCLFTAKMYGIEVTWSWVAAAFLLSFILSVATPPVLGGSTVCFSILFSQLGLKSEALAVIISINAFLEFLTVAVNNYSLQSQIVLNANAIGKLNADKLRS